MTFGEATIEMEAGSRVRRRAWNGKNMHIVIRPGKLGVVTEDDAQRHGLVQGTRIQKDAFVEMFTAYGSLIPWLASQADVLSSDWEVV